MAEPIERQATLRVDRRALSKNLDTLKQQSPTSRVLLMVKANAYGLGQKLVVQALSDQVDGFGCTTTEEALALRQAIPTTPIIVLHGPRRISDYHRCLRFQLTPVVHQPYQLSQWLAILADKPPATAVTFWVKLNSGMNRLGFDRSGAIDAIQRLQAHGIKLVLMTHFATASAPLLAENPTYTHQLEVFNHLCESFPDLPVSIANSPATLQMPESLEKFHRHRETWLRLGAAVYGVDPLDSTGSIALQPVAEFSAPVLAVYPISAGAQVGYGGEWRASKPETLAVIGAGYGDGYPQKTRAGTPVTLVNPSGAIARGCVVGRVSMDLCTICLQQGTAAPGDKAVFWGINPSINTVASYNRFSAYELSARLSQQIRRVLV